MLRGFFLCIFPVFVSACPHSRAKRVLRWSFVLKRCLHRRESLGLLTSSPLSFWHLQATGRQKVVLLLSRKMEFLTVTATLGE